MERLREIPLEGADYQYFASTLGKIYRWNGKNFKELRGWNHYYKRWDRHYRRYGIKINGTYKNMYGQRLVLLAFAGLPPNSNDVARHGPNGSLDNRPCQLEWGTHQQNMSDDRKRDGNYYNRGRKKTTIIVEETLTITLTEEIIDDQEIERWDYDPDHDSFWDQVEQDWKNGVVHECPF